MFHHVDCETVPYISIFRPFNFYSIESYRFIHDFQESSDVLQLRSQPQSHHIIATLHDLKTSSTEIGMRDSCCYCKALSRRKLLILQQAGNQYASIIGELFLNLFQDRLSLWDYIMHLSKQSIDHQVELFLRQRTYLSYHLLDTQTLPAFQQREGLLLQERLKSCMIDDAEEALKVSKSKEHFWLLVIVWIYSWLLQEQPLSLCFVGMQLDRKRLLHAEYLEQKWKILLSIFLEILRQSLLLIKLRWSIRMCSHPQLRISVMLLLSKLVDQTIFARTAPLVLHYFV